MTPATTLGIPLCALERPSLPEPAGNTLQVIKLASGFSWAMGYPWHAVVNRYTTTTRPTS